MKEHINNQPTMSISEVTKKYNTLMEDVATKDFYKIDTTNRVNCYTCKQCKHITKTRDIDPGITPAFFNCELCEGSASSSFFCDIAPNQEPTLEWYRPSLREMLKMRGEPALLDHFFNGGLDIRPVKRELAPDQTKKEDRPPLSRRERRAQERKQAKKK